jgi:hypothetical protein
MSIKRFYDGEPTTSQVVNLMLKFPDELQTVLGNSMSEIAARDFNADEILNDLKSLGTEKVLSMYKSKQKKRDYDRNAAFHQAMNYMMVMSSQNRQAISGKVLVLMGHMQEYLQVCKERNASPSAQVMADIADVYIKEGSDQAKGFISELKIEPDASLNESLRSEEEGMRIKGDCSSLVPEDVP